MTTRPTAITLSSLRAQLAALLSREPTELDIDAGLFEVVEDSLHLVEIVVGLQQHSGVSLGQAELGQCRSVRDLLQAILERAGAQSTTPETR